MAASPRTDGIRSPRAHPAPRLEPVLNAAQGRAELRVMAQHDVNHGRLLQPRHAGRRVDLRRKVGGEEAVAVQPAGRHDDEDAEGGVAETETSRLFLGQHSDYRIDGVDVTVEPAERGELVRVIGEFLETAGRPQVKEPAELVVAWYAKLPGAQDVGGRQVHQPVVIWPLELLQETRVIVQDERAGMGGGEAIDDIAH